MITVAEKSNHALSEQACQALAAQDFRTAETTLLALYARGARSCAVGPIPQAKRGSGLYATPELSLCIDRVRELVAIVNAGAEIVQLDGTGEIEADPGAEGVEAAE